MKRLIQERIFKAPYIQILMALKLNTGGVSKKLKAMVVHPYGCYLRGQFWRGGDTKSTKYSEKS